jgi:NAD(P)-dependent dehydrogenase (short-subunit alcohol dehydrogenase family)
MHDHDLADLEGQVAIVTGAGQGAGRAIARELARHNCGGVAVNDFVAARAEAVAAEIIATGVPAMPVSFDVGDLTAVQAANRAITDTLGTATILVNNAGNAGPVDDINFSPMFWEDDPIAWDKFFRTNMYGVMNCAHTFIPNMVEARRGRIVTIVSDAGRVGEARLVAYSTAKAGAAGFVRAIAKETGRWNITCNAISLSTLEPPMPPEQLAEYVQTERAKAYVSRYVIRRYGKPEDVAGLATFLCSKAAEWITGQTYPVNGGYSFAI